MRAISGCAALVSVGLGMMLIIAVGYRFWLDTRRGIPLGPVVIIGGISLALIGTALLVIGFLVAKRADSDGKQ